MRRLALTLVVAAAAVGFPGGAAAGWSLLGSGGGKAKAKTLNAGNVPTLTNGSGHNVSVAWAASTYANGGAPQGYLIKRYTSAGVFSANACGGTVITTLNCTDSASKGTWKYTVTPATGNWRGAESALSAGISA
jgi:hypothetical protein